MPVIVPPAANAAAILHPTAAAIRERMALDIRDALSPPSRPRLAVLTFDDGPYPVTTPVLLATLKQLKVPAIFFLVGKDALEQPAIAAALGKSGMEIGNHTLTHPQMPTLRFPAQLEEVVDGARALQKATGRQTHYFRPPHGNFDDATLLSARSAAETVVLWDIDPGDWRTVTPDTIVTHVIARARTPAVILFHNGKEATVQALPRIVSGYRRAGFRFVTLSQLRRALSIDAINDPVHVKIL